MRHGSGSVGRGRSPDVGGVSVGVVSVPDRSGRRGVGHASRATGGGWRSLQRRAAGRGVCHAVGGVSFRVSDGGNGGGDS